MFSKKYSTNTKSIFIREFQQLMHKYNCVNEEDTEKIERLLRLTKKIEGKEYIFQDLNREH